MISKENTKQEFIFWITKQIDIDSKEAIEYIKYNKQTSYNNFTGQDDTEGYHAHRIKWAKKEAMDNIIELIIVNIKNKIQRLMDNDTILKEDKLLWNNAFVLHYNNAYREYERTIKKIYLQDRDKLRIEPEAFAKIFLANNYESFDYEKEKQNEEKDPFVRISKIGQDLQKLVNEVIEEFVINYHSLKRKPPHSWVDEF